MSITSTTSERQFSSTGGSLGDLFLVEGCLQLRCWKRLVLKLPKSLFSYSIFTKVQPSKNLASYVSLPSERQRQRGREGGREGERERTMLDYREALFLIEHWNAGSQFIPTSISVNFISNFMSERQSHSHKAKYEWGSPWVSAVGQITSFIKWSVPHTIKSL